MATVVGLSLAFGTARVPPSIPRRIARALGNAAEWLFGAAALTLGLAVLAAIPVLQLLSLGYLIEASARIASTGRLRDGFVGVRLASRLGSIALGTWLWLLPLRLVANRRTAAYYIDPEGPTVRRWQTALVLLTALVVLHVLSAVARGGRLRSFFWPALNPWRAWRAWRQGGAYARARDPVYEFVVALRLPHYARQGLLGFLAGAAWLFGPVTLIALGRRFAPLGFIGAAWLVWVVCYVPWVQVHLAEQQNWRAAFRTRAIRQRFRSAPLAFAIAMVATLLLAIPLHLLKIEMIPREAAWLPSLFFVGFMFPARLLVGWAWGRSSRQATPRFWLSRLVARLLMLTAAMLYVFIVFFSQYAAWYGIWSLYEQHAFLLPAPFLGY